MSARTTALTAPIFGVDVHSGDVRGDGATYALVVLEDGDIERTVVSRRKLLRRIDEERPDIVATDNAFELAANKDALVSMLGALPGETRLVQVTGDERPEPLSRVAHRHDVPYGKDPMEEAEAAARLAAANVGSVLRAFGDTTAVKVSRGRSTGKGGWSADRHVRRMHGAVKRRAREIETELEEAGLTFDVETTEKYGGFANAVFTVEAGPAEIPVTTGRSGDIRVELERERRDGITFEPLATRRDHVIVGIDPGTTTAVAVVNVDGEVLDRYSTRTDDVAAVIEWIVDRGRPFLVAADVTPMPGTVDKIRRSFDATGWTPESDLLVDRKQHRTRDVAYENDHERDALAAALFAADDHATQFERIAAKVPARIDRDAVIARVVGNSEAVSDVIADLSPETADEEESEGDPSPEPPGERSFAREQERRIDRLEEYVGQLTEALAEREDRIEELETELEESRREERVEARERRNVTRLERETERLERERDEWQERARELEETVERLKSLWRLDHSNFSDVAPEDRALVPVKPVEKFTVEAFEDADAAFGLAPNDVILLRDATGAGERAARHLADLEPRAVLADGGLTDISEAVLFDAEVPFGDRSTVHVQEVDQLAVAREDDVESLVAAWRDRAEQRRRAKKTRLVDQVISEHRADRTIGPS